MKHELRELIRHIQIHSSYPDCGYLQMTTEQKAIYDKIYGRISPIYERLDEDQKRRYDRTHKKAKRARCD